MGGPPVRLAAFLTPLGWMAVAAALLILAGGLRWDPFDLAGRRLRLAEARASAAARAAAALALEAEGERDQQSRAEAAEAVAAEARVATTVLTHQARSADDANTPLSPARADRLLAHDRELCRIAPRLGGCAAPAAAARDGHDALRPAAPAGGTDPL